MIKWILFDQAGVQTYPVFSRKNTYTIKGKIFSSKELEAIFHTERYPDYMIGKISEREFIKEFLSASKLNITVEEYIELFKKGIEPIPGMKEILESLKARYSLATLINESSEWANYKLDVSKFREFFEINVVSGDIGYAKPEAAFYMRALDMLKTKPAECIFVDDKKENCEAAKNLGIEAILFRNPEQLRKELASYSIRLS